ncbi:leucine-rich repeat protein [Butyrivibrio sp. VCD2006]|uniref:leucine-rich repeat protein n=1 Tax=Butyrivibrio sp. VCD2006 TaxID=1280664 RepID=UPI0004230E20|nr:leucine-rich repeat protein [Butyrivibrio sp. VCD2006]
MKLRKRLLAWTMVMAMSVSMIPSLGMTTRAEAPSESIEAQFMEIGADSDSGSNEAATTADQTETEQDQTEQVQAEQNQENQSETTQEANSDASDNASVPADANNESTAVTGDEPAAAQSSENTGATEASSENSSSDEVGSAEQSDAEVAEDSTGTDEATDENSTDITSVKSNEELTDEEIERLHATDVPLEDAEIPVNYVEVTEQSWAQSSGITPRVRNAGSEGSVAEGSHQIVLLLDVSGSMAGKAMTEMKKACNNFIGDILSEDPNAGISIVTFANSVTSYMFSGEYFSSDQGELCSIISQLNASGGTGMYNGMVEADEILSQFGTADHKFIITMADGLPNQGGTYYGSDARFSDGYEAGVYKVFSEIESNYEMYSLGFFHSMSDYEKQHAGEFMSSLANRAYFEVTDADLISFTFEEIASNINSDMLKLSQESVAMVVGDVHVLTLDFTDSYTNPDRTVTWGSSNTTIAVVNEGVVTAVHEGECVITATAGGYAAVCKVVVTGAPEKLSKKIFTVYKNKNDQTKAADYEIAKDAKIIYGTRTITTNASGKATVDNVSTGSLTVALDGYRSRTFDVTELGDTVDVYLQKETDNPVINAIYIGSTDVLIDELAIALGETAETTIVADIDWGASEYKSIRIAQNMSAINFTGNSMTAVLKDQGFNVSKDIYLIATNKEDKSTKVKLEIVADSKLNGLEKLKFGVGNGDLSITCPKDWFIIGGQKIKIDVDALDHFNFPVSASVEDGIVMVTGGIDIAKVKTNQVETRYYKSGKKKYSKDDVNKGLFYDIKKGLTEGNDETKRKYVKSIRQKYKEAITRPSVKFGVDGDFSVIFYIEGYLDNNNQVQFVEGKVCLMPSVGVNWSGQFAIGPVPCYWEAAIKGEVEAVLNLRKGKNLEKVIPDGSLKVTIKGEAGAGVGVNTVATVGGGASLKIIPEVTFYPEKNPGGQLTVSLNGYFKLKVFAFEYRHDFDPIKTDPPIKFNSPENVKNAAFKSVINGAYDTGSYTLADTSYLRNSEMKVKVLNDGPSEEVQNDAYAKLIGALHENSYENAQPQITALSGNTKLAVWIDGESSDVNKLQLHYSYFDGEAWSEPAVVDDDGTPDNAPQLCASGNRVFVIWQNAERALKDTDTLDAIASNMGIKVAEFKPAKQEFEVSELSKDSGHLDMMPAIQYAGDKVVAAWVENTNNNWFSTAADNTIMTSVYDGTAWSVPESKVESAGPVNSLAVDYKDDTVFAIYSTDTDGNLETVEDLELYVNEKNVSNNDSVDSAVFVKDHVVYWYNNSKIMVSEVGATLSAQEYMGGDITIPTDRYRIVDYGENKAVLFANSDNSVSEIYAIFKQDGKWGYPIRLTDRKNSIQQFDAIWEGENLVLMANEVKVIDPSAEPSEANYGQRDMILMEYEGVPSIVLDDIAYDEEAIVPGVALPITLSVTNNGRKPVNGIRVEMLDESGAAVDELEIGTDIMSGNSADIDYGYVVKDENIGKTYSIRVTPASVSKDAALGNTNTAPISFSFEDLKLDGVQWGIAQKENSIDESEIIISAAIQNLGYSEKQDVKVTLYEVPVNATEDSTEKETHPENMEMVTETTIGNISSLDQQPVEFHVPVPVENDYEKLYYLELTCEGESGSTGNNSGYVCVKEAHNYAVGRTIVDLLVYNLETEFTAGSNWNYQNVSVAAKYDDGTLADVDAQINASGVNTAVPGIYTVYVTADDFTKPIGINVKAKPADPSSITAASGQAVGNTVAVGDTTTEDGIIYEVTSVGDSLTVKVSKPSDKNIKKAVIKGSVTIQNAAYTVTEIGAEAFKDCDALTNVTIPAEVNKIGKKAFYNAEKLKKITIKSTSLTSKTVGSKAFKNAGKNNFKKLKVKVPKKQLKAYKKLLKKKGLSSKAKVSK